jgi:hypothetical protein
VFVIGGKNDLRWLNNVECFDSKTNNWIEVAPLSQPRVDFGAVLIDAFIFVVGGFAGDHILVKEAIERYDIAQNEWTPLVLKVSFPILASSLVLQRTKGTLIILGGSNGQEIKNSVFEVKIEDGTVVTHNDFAHSRIQGKAVGFDNKVFLIGGMKSEGKQEVFDGNTWKEVNYLDKMFSSFEEKFKKDPYVKGLEFPVGSVKEHGFATSGVIDF